MRDKKLNAGQLKKRISVLCYTGIKDISGVPKEVYTTFLRLGARVDFTGADEDEHFDIEVGKTQVVFTIRYRNDLDKKNLIRYDSKIYNIQSILHIEKPRKQFTRIIAENIEINSIYLTKDDMPILGEVRMFPGSSAPVGWAFCDGTLLPVSDFMDLFGVLGNTYGGDATNFALPDARGRVIVHEGTGAGLTARALGDTFGTESVALSESELPVHSHAAGNLEIVVGNEDKAVVTTPTASGNYIGNSTDGFREETGSPNTLNENSITGNTSDTGSGASHNNMQPSLCLNLIIAIKGEVPS